MRIENLLVGPGKATRPYGASATVAFVVGGLLIIWSSYIHFHLWQAVGYRHIPTIGPLFMLQAIVGLLAGILVIGVRRVWAGVIGTGFAVSTLVGFLISVEHGLFGFKDLWSSPYAARRSPSRLRRCWCSRLVSPFVLSATRPSTQQRVGWPMSSREKRFLDRRVESLA